MRILSTSLLLVLSLFSLTGNANSLTLLHSSSEEVHVRAQIHPPESKAVLLYGTEHIEFNFPGFSKTLEPGAPQIPYQDLKVHVPTGSKLLFSYHLPEETFEEELPHDLGFTSFIPIHSRSKRVRKNASAYLKDYGIHAVELLEDSFAGPDRIATFRIWPMAYRPLESSIEFRPVIDLHVVFERSESGRWISPVAGLEGEIATHVSINSPAHFPRRPVVGVDLIIAHKEYQIALSRFLALKRAAGREVRVHYVSAPTTAQIKDIIEKEYQSATPPTTTLLIGSRSQIPMFAGAGDNWWTDFPYQNLDSGTQPDIALGRIPAGNFSGLESTLAKIMARELEPRQNNQVLLTAGRDNSLGCASNVTKVGDKLKAGASTIELIKKYKAQVSTDEIIGAYNASPNIIFYDGHGDSSGMLEVPLVLSNLNRLTNRAYPIIMDIACLNANFAATRNFTEAILSQKDSGAAGLLASGGSGYGYDFFQTIGDYMAKARQSLETDPGLNEIGRIILLSKIKHGQQDRSYWNYYGDPASTVWEHEGKDH